MAQTSPERCYGVELCPLKRCGSPTFSPCVYVTLFQNKVFAEAQIKKRSLGWVSIQQDCVLIKRGNVDPEMETHTGRTACENEGRDWGNSSTSQGMPTLASKPPERGRHGTEAPSQPPKRSDPSNTLISDFYCMTQYIALV